MAAAVAKVRCCARATRVATVRNAGCILELRAWERAAERVKEGEMANRRLGNGPYAHADGETRGNDGEPRRFHTRRDDEKPRSRLGNSDGHAVHAATTRASWSCRTDGG